LTIDINKIYHSEAIEFMKQLPDNYVDLTITSPPYGTIRSYKGYTFDFEGIARQLFRITKQGGVVVWVCADQTINGSESGDSFRQALYFKDVCGFNLHDTQIYQKNNGFVHPSLTRYHQVWEYCFVFVKPQEIISTVPRFDFPFSKEDASWLAAAIDGEGCFNITKQERQKCYTARITLSNTNEDFVNKCKELTKVGSITKYPPRTYAHHKSYLWTSCGTDNIAKIIAEIYPYLIVKKEQAKVMIQYRNIIQTRNPAPGIGRPLSTEEANKRIELYELMKALNQKEVTISGFPEPDFKIRSKGSLNTFNPIRDRKNITAGLTKTTRTVRQIDGTLKDRTSTAVTAEYGMRNNIWKYNVGRGLSSKDDLAFNHPAIFPEQLAADHIISWSNKGDLIFDPMMGSGTVAKMSIILNRNFIGCDISEEYVALAKERIKPYQQQLRFSV